MIVYTNHTLFTLHKIDIQFIKRLFCSANDTDGVQQFLNPEADFEVRILEINDT